MRLRVSARFSGSPQRGIVYGQKNLSGGMTTKGGAAAFTGRACRITMPKKAIRCP